MTYRLVVRTLTIAIAAVASANAQKITDRKDVDPAAPLTVKLAKDATLEIKSLHGEITVVRSKDEHARVSITRDAGATAPRIAMVTHERGVTICTVYTSPNPKKPNECVPRNKGRLTEGVTRQSPSVRFRAEVPDGVHFAGQIVFGDFNADVGASNLDLKSVNGNISIKETGARVVQAETSGKGSIDAVISPADARPERRIVRLGVMMGDLRVAIPRTLPVNYTIMAEQRIDTPFKLERPDPFYTGSLGPAGDPAMTLTLSAGSRMGKVSLQPAPK